MTQDRTASTSRRTGIIWLLFAATVLVCQFATAQLPNRLTRDLGASGSATLAGSLHPLARAEYDRGRASSTAKLGNMTMVFAPSVAQKADLMALLAAQQNPASPLYHKWLTPAAYAARFGMSSEDIATASAWLQARGFVVTSVANSRIAIHFSGTAAQVESAFHTEMHEYQVGGTMHLANSTALTVPAGLAANIAGIRNVAQFRPHPMHVTRRPPASASKITPAYTGAGGYDWMSPGDVTTIYDIKALYNAGYTGTGQSIAIVGQSAVLTSDLNAFQTAAGLPTSQTLNEILVPGSGVSTVYSGDEDESDIDLEYSGAIAKGATLNFVYTGDNSDYGVFDSLEYAIDQNTAPIVSISYGECEVEAGTDPAALEPFLMEANTQGQTILASAGDQGATGCENTDTSAVDASATTGLSVSYPASSAFVTAMGGTEFDEGNATYWSPTNSSDGGSAISYIPEIAWNDTTATYGISATGGGQSILFAKPSWQTGVTIPADGVRDVPDISLDASNDHDSYMYCNEGSCASGFAGVVSSCLSTTTTNYVCTAGGGTSYDAPIMAGIVALINQKNSTTGAGNINTALYSLYSTASTAFHDIVDGNNLEPCTSGSTDCPAGTTQIGYLTATGYDLVTGLGSIDAYNLANVFPSGASTTTEPLLVTTTTLSTPTFGPAVGTAITLTATVSAAAGTTSPTGTVQFAVNGANVGSGVTLTAATASTATATFTTTFTATGTDTVVATYSGDSVNAASTSATVTLTVGTTVEPAPSFTLAATNATIATGSTTGTSTVTLTSMNGYAGTVDYVLSTTSTTLNGCYAINPTTVAAGATATATLTFDISASDCATTGSRKRGFVKVVHVASSAGDKAPASQGRELPITAGAMLAGLVVLVRKRKAWPVLMILALAGLGALGGLSGCGGNSTSTTVTTPTSGSTYTMSLAATDTTNSNLMATTTFTLTVD